MANSVKLEILTPSKRFYSGDVELVIARTLEGDEGFMYGHSWACKLLDIGELWIQEKGADKNDFRIAAVAGGFIEVRESIIIYTDAVEWMEEIDVERARTEKETAEKWLRENEETAKPGDIEQAKSAIARAVLRIDVANGGRRKKK